MTNALATIRHAIAVATSKGYPVAPFVRELAMGPWTSGLTIHNGRYVASNVATLDALGALLWGRRTLCREVTPQGVYRDAAAVLGVMPGWLATFADGFDDDVMEEPFANDEAYPAWKAGQELRRELGWPLGEVA